MQEEFTSFLFPNTFFFAISRCFTEMLVFLGFRFAHCQQQYIKASGPNWANCFFPKAWGLSQYLRDGYFGDYHSVSDGMCRKQDPCCGVRCHSRAYVNHLTGSTFQTFPGWTQFLGLLHRGSKSVLSVLALVQSSGPKRTRRLVPPSVCLGQRCEHAWTSGFFQSEKWKRKRDGIWGTEKGCWAVKCYLCARTR